jgi:hypothetical protein
MLENMHKAAITARLASLCFALATHLRNTFILALQRFSISLLCACDWRASNGGVCDLWARE